MLNQRLNWNTEKFSLRSKGVVRPLITQIENSLSDIKKNFSRKDGVNVLPSNCPPHLAAIRDRILHYLETDSFLYDRNIVTGTPLEYIDGQNIPSLMVLMDSLVLAIDFEIPARPTNVIGDVVIAISGQPVIVLTIADGDNSFPELTFYNISIARGLTSNLKQFMDENIAVVNGICFLDKLSNRNDFYESLKVHAESSSYFIPQVVFECPLTKYEEIVTAFWASVATTKSVLPNEDTGCIRLLTKEQCILLVENINKKEVKVHYQPRSGATTLMLEVTRRLTRLENTLLVCGSQSEKQRLSSAFPQIRIVNRFNSEDGSTYCNVVYDTEPETCGAQGRRWKFKTDNSHKQTGNVQLPCPRYPLDTKCESETDELKKKLANVERENEQLQMKIWKWEQVELRETNLMRWLQHDDLTPSVTSGYGSARASSVCSEDINETIRDTFDSVAQGDFKKGKDRSSLLLACKRGNCSVIKKSLLKGDTDFDSPDENGMTPWMLAMLRQQRMKSSCNEGDLTVDVIGMTGGKAGKVTAVGLEEISRNNKITFEESTYKVKRHGSCNSKKNKGEGMTGGEADEVEVVGMRTVSEGNELTFKGSEVDMSGPALVIKNTTVIQNYGSVSLNQGQNVDTSKTTRDEGGDIEVIRKRMALEGDTIDFKKGKDRSILLLACKRGDRSVIKKYLLKGNTDFENPDENGMTPLMLAVSGGHLESAKLLTDHISTINRKTKGGKTALMIAVYSGYLAIVKHLVDIGADLAVKDNNNNTALHVACYNDNVEFVKYLLTKTPDIEVRGHNGKTALMTAALKGCRKVFDLLLSKGADISVKDDDNDTVLHVACYNDNVEFVKYLLTKSPDIEVRGKYGRTPLMNAARYGCSEVFDLLISHGANPSLTDEQNKNIHHHVSAGGSVNIIQHALSLMDADEQCGDIEDV